MRLNALYCFIVVCSLLILTTLKVDAQDVSNRFYFSHLTSNDGLSSGKVNCIYEDNEGFMWFGTEDGLNLFDGVSFTVFKQEEGDTLSLFNNAIHAVVSDEKNGNLWIGTRKGVCYFNKSNFTFENPFTGYEGINDHIVYSLIFDQSGNLWIGTSYGLYRYQPETGKLKAFFHQSDNSETICSNTINHIYVDNNNRIILATRDGVDWMDAETEKVTHLFEDDSLKNVMHVSKDSYGKFWICTDEMGLYTAIFQSGFVLEQFNPAYTEIHQSRIHSVVEDDDQNLFFVGRDKGLFYYQRKDDRISLLEPSAFNSMSLNSKALISSFYSSTGILWLGTFNRGLNVLDRNRKKFEHYKMNYKNNGLFNNNVRSFFEDQEGNIWIGTKEEGGLSKFDPETGTFVNFPYNSQSKNSFSSDYILSINELDKHTLMLGTLGQGIDLFDKNTLQVKNRTVGNQASENKIYAIYKDLEKQVWVASLGLLFKYDEENKTFNPVGDFRAIKCFAQTQSTTLWMGTRFNGLIVYENDEFHSFEQYESLKAITTNEVTSLRFGNDSILWVGTIKGLYEFNVHSLALKSWTVKDGLPSNRISSMELDDYGNLWISTSNGLSKFNPDQNEFRNYFVEDGLQGNDFEMYISLKDRNGKLYFGGGNGFNVFHPDEIRDNTVAPKIHFTSFKIANQEVNISDENAPLSQHINRTQKIVLTHSQSDFTFEFVALNYTSPDKNSYKYMLEGYDKDWIIAGTNRLATYTNIQQGEYIFKVKGANNDNYWNEQGREILITVLPPPWKSKWAYALYLVIIGLLVMAFYFVIVNRIEQQNLLRLERHEREKTELVNQLKLRFFTNISHEFRTPLTLISSPLSKLIQQPNLTGSERQYLYATMHKNVKRLLRLIKQLMDFRKLENQQLSLKVAEGDLVAFIKEIIKGFEETAFDKNIDFDFEYPENEEHQYWFDPNVMDNVLFNLLSNALKFSPPNSCIQVVLKNDEREAQIHVIDHGVGIAPDKLDKVFDRFYSESFGSDVMSGTGIGLSFSQNLIKLHKGEISVQSIPNKETCFCVSFPLSAEAYAEEEIAQEKVIIDRVGQLENKVSGNQLPEGDSPVAKNEKLLIVEDNKELRGFLKHQFAAYQVFEAEDGAEALKIALKELPDCVISDVMMPIMDGVQFCSRLKKNYVTSHIPIILLTAKTASEHKIEGMESGADAYIEKPFDINVLEAQLKNLITQRKKLRKRFANLKDIDPEEVNTTMIDRKFFEKAEHVLVENISKSDFSVEEFGSLLNMSRSQLFRKFKAITDGTPSDFIRNERIKLAKKMLLEGGFNVNEIAHKTGFNSSSHFIATFKKITGFTPKEFSQR